VIGALSIGIVVGLVPAAEHSFPARAAIALGVAQKWTMYRNIKDDYVRLHAVGTLADGAAVDLGTDRGQLLDSPLEDWVRTYRGDVVLEAMSAGDPQLLRAFARFVCRRWNSD